ncbi:recombination-associated protein RdgC [Moellerella wisconsensis]|uniref:recombination-associated protein RdgC n=1 Tax=Moellerella wisconsensis TaxID=158849 RepID=UPI001F4E7B70|nr:recombination-associated protein RdgC [Moellerella wisconsensis]UNH43506.1 recombination-associated protein RdgC [Moellerella wisconsensis]
MKRFPITSAVIFKAELPSAEVLERHLKELPFVDILESHAISYGFIPNKITGELVTPIEGGYIITFRIDEKILPKAAIAFEVNRRIEKLKEQGIDNFLEVEIKHIAIEEMLKVVLTKTKIITALYHVKKGFLFVSTTRKPEHQALLSSLVKVCGTVKTETFNIDDAKNGITARLSNHIDNLPPADCFGNDLYPGNFLLLQRKFDKKLETLKYDAELNLIRDQVKDSIENNFKVNLIELSTFDISFKLTNDFDFKSIKPQTKFECDGDKAFCYRHTNAVFMFHMVNTIELLIELLKYKEKTE